MAPGMLMVGIAVYALAWTAVAALLAVMCAIDVRTRRIPNKLVVGVCMFWVSMQAWSWAFGASTGISLAEAVQAQGIVAPVSHLFALPSMFEGAFTAIVSVLLLAGMNIFFERCFRKQAMGFGDVKLFGAFALFLGPVPTIVCMMLACVFALATALPLRMRTFPFAPALTVAFVCVMLVEL